MSGSREVKRIDDDPTAGEATIALAVVGVAFVSAAAGFVWFAVKTVEVIRSVIT